MPQDLQLMYLMCSKLCHDLAAPIGAISIGLEMLDENPEPDSPQALLLHSVQSAMNKLELIRCLSGYATYQNKPTLLDIKIVLDKCIDPDKIKITWLADNIDAINGTPARLYNALMILSSDALPRGGSITLNKDYTITVTGPLVKFPEAVLAAITGQVTLSDIDSRSIIGYFINKLASQLETKVQIDFTQPNLALINFQ
jgi:histidine phosphotransferase ChpT